MVTNTVTRSTTGATAVTDTLPAGVTFISGSGSGWSVSESAGIVTATHAGAIANGDSASFTLTVDVGAGAVPGVTNTAHVATPGDLSAANDDDSDVTDVTGTPDVTLDKRHTVAFQHGQNGSWTLVVTNSGSAATSGATTVTDTLPSGVTFVSGSGGGWSVSESGGIVAATHAGAIANGDSASFTLTVAVGAGAVPGVPNTAHVATPGDLSAANDDDSDATTVD